MAKNIGKDIPLLTSLYINPTRFCNLRCKHCWIAAPYSLEKSQKYDLDSAFFMDIIRQAKKLGLQTVKLTGSEPLIYRNAYDLIKGIKSENLFLSIETNGVTIDKFNAKTIGRLGVNHVSVSLDGTSPFTHEKIRGVEGSFDKALQGARNLAKEKLNVQIIFTLLRENLDELEEMPFLAKSTGAGSLKINVVMPLARAKKVEEEGGLLSLEENIDIFKRFEEKFIKNRTSPINIYYDMPAAFFDAVTLKNGYKLSHCNIKNILGILPKGQASICGIGFVRKDLIFGDLNKQSLEDIWTHSQTLKKIRKDVPDNIKGVCSMCMFNKFCMGRCVANNIYTTERHDVSGIFCQQAYDKGLFPPTRLL